MLKGADGDMLDYILENFHPQYDSINKSIGLGFSEAKLPTRSCR